ncbi:hypothetical protein MMC21_006122 [Puttea exsequens]|nr:hypothetical protein [Puttea exsequens]
MSRSKNHISNIAIVGAGGQVGTFIVASLLARKQFTVTALTRADSTTAVPNGVKTVKVSYSNHDSLVKALTGQDALIITMAVTAPPDQQSRLIEAAAAASVPWILPNEWGIDGANAQLGKDTLLGEKLAQGREHIERLGVSAWIAFACSFWYEFSLGGGEERYGFDFEGRKVTFFDEGRERINTSTWKQTGEGVASLLALKVKGEGEEACLEHFRNRFVYVSSFLVSQRDMFESVLRVTGTKEGDWQIGYEDSKERYQRGMKELQAGNRKGFMTVLYTRVFWPDGAGNFEEKRGLQNEVLGLQKEDLDENTKLALEFAETQKP